MKILLTIIFILYNSLSFYLPAQITTFYGMTTQGGANDEGVIFKFNLLTKTESVLCNFGNEPQNGYNTQGNLVLDSSSFLFYGLAKYSSGVGAVFSFNPVKDTVLGCMNMLTLNGQWPQAA